MDNETENGNEIPLAEVDTPVPEVETPIAEEDTPTTKVDTPITKVEPPEAEVEPPEAEVETPVTEVETPEAEVETTLTDVEMPLAEIGDPVADTGDEIPVADTGDEIPVADTGNEIPVADTGNEIPVADTGDEIPIADTGDEIPEAEISDNTILPSAETNEAETLDKEDNPEVPVENSTLELENTIEVEKSAVEEESSTDVNNAIVDSTTNITEETKMETLSIAQETVTADTGQQVPENEPAEIEEIPPCEDEPDSMEISEQLQPIEQKQNASKTKLKSGTFSLGVPGLTFSAQNLKVADDGTKMVQIHQSQITPTQLKALQSNPNIKVVFRHIPTGKSFSKPPKNLFSSLSKQQGTKRKHSEDGDGADESIYNFDEDFDVDKSNYRPKSNGNVSKYARYTPNVGMKKRGPGRPRIIPETIGMTAGMSGKMKTAIPSQIMLTDAIAKLNKPNAAFTVKIHIKQVTHDVLANMELHPNYNIVLTAKHDLSPEHSLAELVKEWEEKEKFQEPQDQSYKMDEVVEEREEEVQAKIAREKVDQKLLSQQMKEKEERREREEAELLAAAMQERTSRSGRVRKPSRYSLDIARLTKRKSALDDISPDEEFVATPKPKPPPKPPVTSASKPSGPPSVKRGRGRPRKIRPVETESSPVVKESTSAKAAATPLSSPPRTVEPRVLMSPTDKKIAETMRLKDQTSSEGEKTDSDEKKDSGNGTTTENEKSTTENEKSTTENEKSTTENEKSTTENVKSTTETEESAIVAEEPKDTEAKTDDKTDSTDKDGAQQSEETTETDIIDTSESKVAVEPVEKMETDDQNESAKTEPARKTSSEAAGSETPSDILARKLDITAADAPASTEKEGKTEVEKNVNPQLTDFVEEEGDVDNKYRLRKLLQQCTIDEIRSVAIPRALDAISLGDFFLSKAGQMSSKEASYTALYKQIENLYTAVEKESVRYNTLLRRANKVGGDRRMDKVILMPVYHKKAAESVHINSSSIDAHIGGIHQKNTPQMIVANSFRMNCKMETPLHRLKLPDLADKGIGRVKRKPVQPRNPKQPEPDSTTPDQPSHGKRAYTGAGVASSWRKSNQVRKPSYLLGSTPGTAHNNLQEHARMQLVGRYQSQTVIGKEQTTTSTTIVDSSTPSAQVTQSSDVVVTGLGQEGLHGETVDVQQGTQVVADDGTTVVAAEEGKQLVAIGDGQYVELPEGYTLIQTDEGYIIGQPGATFVQGEDGNVYITSTEEGTEASDQILTTTATIAETATSDAVLQFTQT